MSTRRIVVLGGGEHAAVLVDAALLCPDRWDVVGYTAPNATLRLSERFPSVAWLGADDAAVLDDPGTTLIVGFGGGTKPGSRALPVDRLEDATWATVVHPAAWLSPRCRLSEGIFVGAGAIVQAGASIGSHAIINTAAVVEHDVEVGSFAHIGPGAVLGGGAHIGEAAFVGLGARVRDHVSIGARAVVAMGAVVVQDVPADAIVTGTPARSATAPDEAASVGEDGD